MNTEELFYKILIPISSILIIIVWSYIIRLKKRNIKPNIYTKIAGIILLIVWVVLLFLLSQNVLLKET